MVEMYPWPVFTEDVIADTLDRGITATRGEWQRYCQRNPAEQMPTQSAIEVAVTESAGRLFERQEARAGTIRHRQMLEEMTATERAAFRKAQRESRAQDAVTAEAMARFRMGR